jgi:hypothetical protein
MRLPSGAQLALNTSRFDENGASALKPLPSERPRTTPDRTRQALPGVEIEPSAIYTAEATQVLIDAIARSDGSRAGVLDELFRTSLRRGLTGGVRFDDRGDIVAPPITILRIGRDENQLRNFPGARLARLVRTPAD